MSDVARSWVGADPGGKHAFGIALLRSDGFVHYSTVDCADAAVSFVLQNLSEPLGGVGVDAPLWWSSGPAGDRKADQWLRKQYKLSGGQVQAANSLRGAALTQAAMFLVRLREHFPALPITEAHPKAVLNRPMSGGWESFSEQYLSSMSIAIEHSRDAVIAAVAAREGFEKRWSRDLSLDRSPSEQDPRNYWLAPVHYFWPND